MGYSGGWRLPLPSGGGGGGDGGGDDDDDGVGDDS